MYIFIMHFYLLDMFASWPYTHIYIYTYVYVYDIEVMNILVCVRYGFWANDCNYRYWQEFLSQYICASWWLDAKLSRVAQTCEWRLAASSATCSELDQAGRSSLSLATAKHKRFGQKLDHPRLCKSQAAVTIIWNINDGLSQHVISCWLIPTCYTSFPIWKNLWTLYLL